MDFSQRAQARLAIERLNEAVEILDAIGLSVAAAHACHSIDIVKERLVQDSSDDTAIPLGR